MVRTLNSELAGLFTPELIRRILYFIAVGDSLGLPFETCSREEIQVIVDGRNGRNVQDVLVDRYYPPDTNIIYAGCKTGTWSDDTELTLATMEGITYYLRNNGRDTGGKFVGLIGNISEQHVRALERSSRGWGKETTRAIQRYKADGDLVTCGLPDPQRPNSSGGGNGVAMKIAPLTTYLFWCRGYNVDDMLVPAVESIVREYANITHNSVLGRSQTLAMHVALWYVLSCQMPNSSFDPKEFWCLIVDAVKRAEPKDYTGDCISQRLYRILNLWEELPFMSYEEMIKRTGNGSFYVLESLSLALYLFARGPESIETLYRAVSLFGGDTNTVGAVVGALLAVYGEAELPDYLIEGLQRKEEIDVTVDAFCDASGIR